MVVPDKATGLAEIEQEAFGVVGGGEGEGGGGFGADGIAGGQGGIADGHVAFDELEPEAAAVAELVGDGFVFGEADAVDVGVLLDGGGAVTAVAGDDEDFGCGFAGGVGMPLGVAGDEVAFARLDPDLQHVGGDVWRGIELAMEDTFAGAHELDLAGLEDAAIAEAVFVLESAFDDVGEDFHVAVRVGGEAAAGGDVVFVDDAQAAEAHVGGVVVIGEGEGMMGLEPAMVGVAAFGGAADGEGMGCGFHGFAGVEETIQKRFAGGCGGKRGLGGEELMERSAFHYCLIIDEGSERANATCAG